MTKGQPWPSSSVIYVCTCDEISGESVLCSSLISDAVGIPGGACNYFRFLLNLCYAYQGFIQDFFCWRGKLFLR